MDKPQATIDEIMEFLHTDLMGFLQENMVTREEFKREMNRLDGRINQTKLDLLDAMDEKLGAMKGDIVVMMRNEDLKVMLVVKKLKEKKIFDDVDVEEFMRLLPFPQIVRPS